MRQSSIAKANLFPRLVHENMKAPRSRPGLPCSGSVATSFPALYRRTMNFVSKHMVLPKKRELFKNVWQACPGCPLPVCTRTGCAGMTRLQKRSVPSHSREGGNPGSNGAFVLCLAFLSCYGKNSGCFHFLFVDQQRFDLVFNHGFIDHAFLDAAQGRQPIGNVQHDIFQDAAQPSGSGLA